MGEPNLTPPRTREIYLRANQIVDIEKEEIKLYKDYKRTFEQPVCFIKIKNPNNKIFTFKILGNCRNTITQINNALD